jgi:hypothetical protein
MCAFEVEESIAATWYIPEQELPRPATPVQHTTLLVKLAPPTLSACAFVVEDICSTFVPVQAAAVVNVHDNVPAETLPRKKEVNNSSESNLSIGRGDIVFFIVYNFYLSDSV